MSAMSVADLQAKIKEAGDKVKALKLENKPKNDPELVDAVAELNKCKAELTELTKPVETNPFAKCRSELEDITKRRFFYRPAFDIYGGTAGFYTYGPPGSALKANITALWRKHFIIEENLMEIEDPTIMPHDVLKTSGHVDRFNDFMVKDSKQEDKFFRADKLLEEEMENRLKVPTITADEKTQYKKDLLAADSFSREELGAKLKEYGIKAPETGNDLTEPYEFNLMFPTPIGPSGLIQGYLRPETAQGIFLNYKFCAEQNADKMPFGVAQIGKSYRNEIAPRGGLVRQREFTQAEIEFFCRPKNKDFAKFKSTGVDQLYAPLIIWIYFPALSKVLPWPRRSTADGRVLLVCVCACVCVCVCCLCVAAVYILRVFCADVSRGCVVRVCSVSSTCCRRLSSLPGRR